MCEEFNIDVKAAGAHAPWQHGFCERHGGILGRAWVVTVQQMDVDSRGKAMI